MRRGKKDIAYILKGMERPIDRTTSVGIVSSIGGDGKTINGQHYNDGEIRDMDIALPYGISSSGIDGIKVQIITNGNEDNTVVGVINDNRPSVKSGCLILYDKSGQRILLNGDGTIRLTGSVYINGTPFSEILDKISKIDELSNTLNSVLDRLNTIERKL